ncbi:hypothetical protein D3C85_1488920 [compost metagenome]
MLKTGDQAVDGEGIAPGRLDPVEAWWSSQAAAAGQPGVRQRQGADLAACAEPRQFAFTADAETVRAVGGLVAEQTGLFSF